VTVPRLAALGVTALLAACGEQHPPMLEERILAMGTMVDIALEAPSQNEGEAAVREAEAMLREYERDYYPWSEGELARLNAGIREGRPVTVTPAMARLLGEARALSSRSKGLFDPGVEPLVQLWGFDHARSLGPAPPKAEAIAALLARRSSIAALRIDGVRVESRSKALQLDLGGIAKGQAVDEIIELLRRHGVTNAMVNAGGDLRVIGRHRARAWRIGIKDPRRRGVLGAIELRDGEAAFTSGDYERYFEYHGTRYHHLLDPATGRPATHTRAVTVIAEDGVKADAAATALFVAGPTRWRSIAETLGVRYVLRVDASGQIELTEPMRRRLETTDGRPTSTLLGSRS
jgi:thiamine biosynthesis lipoprotein